MPLNETGNNAEVPVGSTRMAQFGRATSECNQKRSIAQEQFSMQVCEGFDYTDTTGHTDANGHIKFTSAAMELPISDNSAATMWSNNCAGV